MAGWRISRIFVNMSMSQKILSGKRAIVTIGSTIEKIDDVRYISNFSSGRQGLCFAEVLQNLGADVTAIVGNVSVDCSSIATAVRVDSAENMYKAVVAQMPCDIFISAAAGVDFKPDKHILGKVKKCDLSVIRLVENVDILAILASVCNASLKPRCVVGFALESSDLLENAQKKMKRKGCDIMIANKLVFGELETSGYIISEGAMREFSCTKSALAADVCGLVVGYF